MLSMNNKITQITCLTLAMGLFVTQNAMAAKVYQWTDEEGVVQFSDVPPKDNTTADVQEIEFVNYAEIDAGSDEYSITNQLERMTEWRRQITEERLARRQLQLEAERLAQEKNANRYSDINTRSYTPVYYYPSPSYFPHNMNWHGHHHPGHHPGTGNTGGTFHYKVDSF